MKEQSSPDSKSIQSGSRTTANGSEPPFEPSWIDRFTNWVEQQSIRSWIFYLGLGVALVLVQIIFLWIDGGLQAVELLPIIIFNGLAIPFLLSLIHFLDTQAVAALSAMRTALDTTELELHLYEYRLSNMAFLAPLIAGLIVTVGTILSPQVSIEPVRYAALEQLPIFEVVYHIVDKGSAFLMGVFLYHTIRQLYLVNSINSRHIRVNLFHLKPLQAFSRLTASTAAGLVVFVYAWMLINPELLADPVIFAYLVMFTVLAALVFVWPLYGVHRHIEMEKEIALQDLELRFEAIFSNFDQRLQENDFSAIERLNGAISSLEIQHRRVSAIPTWPWRLETARFAFTAIALPLLLMILQYFVLQALDR